MKKLFILLLLTLIIPLFFLNSVKALSEYTEKYDDWTSYHFYSETWGMRIDKTIEFDYMNEIEIKVPESDSNLISKSGVNSNIIIEIDGITEVIPFNSILGYIPGSDITNGFTLKINHVFMSTYFDNYKVEDIDRIVVHVVQNTNYSNGLGIPSGYVNYYNENGYMKFKYSIMYPAINDYQHNITSMELIDSLNNIYRFFYKDGTVTKNIVIQLPNFITAETNINNFLLEFNEEFDLLYYFSKNHTYVIDINNSTYEEITKFKTVGFVQKEPSDVAVLYMFLPKTADYLISVDLQYKYRLKDFFWGYGDWLFERKVYNYLNDDNQDWFDKSITEIDPPLYMLYLFHTLYFILDHVDTYNQETIQSFSFQDLPTDVKSKYIERFSDSPEEFTQFTYFKIVLGQFRTFTSVGFDISDMVIIELTYLENGEYITLSREMIDQKIEDFVESNPTFDEILDWVIDGMKPITDLIESKFAKIGSVLFTVVIFLGSLLLFTKLITKNFKGRIKNRYKRKN